MAEVKGKRKLLEDSDSESDDGGAPVGDTSFKVNEEYAKRFEYNKKREERQKLEEKFKSASNRDQDGEDDESSSDETEDDEGFLATEDLDAQISATLQALRSKDPRVYDSNVTFYQPEDADGKPQEKVQKEKPVYLKDYHREKFMRGDVGASDDEEEEGENAQPTYFQEQDALKNAILDAAGGNAQDSDGDSDDEDGFMKRKEPVKAGANGVHPSRAAGVKTSVTLDVSGADRDPETFLSNFMSARAWVPEEGGKWKAFESDEGEDDDEADQFEQAYNLRFEDPAKSNEVLKSYSRQLTNSRSVRREEKSGRKRQRETEKEQKEEEQRQRKEEKGRLRKLKLEEAEGRLQKIKQAAGAVGKSVGDEDWLSFLNDAWEDDKWEQAMKRRFGDEYYAMNDDEMGRSDDEEDAGKAKGKSKKPKKPKWNDDIAINDIIPEFKDEDDRPSIALSDDEGRAGANGDEDVEMQDADDDVVSSRPSKKLKTADHKRARLETQKKARQERTKLEALVDSKLELTDHDILHRAKPQEQEEQASHTAFRYRETSPQSFGMTARDILLAPSDQALNNFAGLKKLATFRDDEKKRRDKKRLGKKARLREWRRDTFGRDFERTGPTYGFEHFADAEDAQGNGEAVAGKVIEPKGDEQAPKKKKKRSRGKKTAAS